MNAFRFLRGWCLRACLFALPALVFAGPNSPAVKVQVITPAGWNAAQAERCAELFGASLRSALARQGLNLPIETLRSAEDPARAPYLLRVNLTDWRVRDGNLACSFSATLRTPAGEQPVGVYANTLWAPGVIAAEFGQPYYALSPDSIRTLAAQLTAHTPNESRSS